MARHTGVALSGGGHRASLWGLGALLYLVDSGRNRDVGAISSVSGGSITNGVVAQEVDFEATDAASFDRAVTPLVRHIADEGLFFWGRSTNPYVFGLFALLVLAVGSLGYGGVFLAKDGLGARSGSGLLVGLLLLILAAAWFERRSVVVDRALAKTHFSRAGRPTKLADIDRAVDHVFCATELQSSQHCYFAPRFVYSYEFGSGAPRDTALSTAVQASACLPGAFTPRVLRAQPMFPVRKDRPQLVLTDGGVYDNMGDQWLVGLRDRLARPDPPDVENPDLRELVVVNASAASPWSAWGRMRLIVQAELATLLRVKDVMYQVTTERRRSALYDAWTRAGRDDQRGVFVHIAQTPYTVADKNRDSDDAGRRARAEAVLTLLGDDAASRQRWKEQSERCRGVKTVLRKLGRPTTLELLEHSYVLTMCNMHVVLGQPLPDAMPHRGRFERLLTSG